MNYIQEKYNNYVSIINRSRWFILTSTIIASLSLLHVGLEKFSYQESQLEAIYARRIIDSTEHKIDSLEKYLKNNISAKDSLSYKEALKVYKEKKFKYELTENTLKSMKLDDVSMPLIGFPVKSNDYVIVSFSFIMIFSICLWLTLQSLQVIINQLYAIDDQELHQLVKDNFTFTGLPNTKGENVAIYLQKTAFYFPTISMCISILLDFWPILSRESGFAGSNFTIYSRLVFLAIITILVFFICNQ